MEELEHLQPIGSSIDKDEEARIWSEISKIDGISEYLRELMAADLRLHFSCNKAEQDIVRGGYFRVQHFLKLLKQNSLTK